MGLYGWYTSSQGRRNSPGTSGDPKEVAEGVLHNPHGDQFLSAVPVEQPKDAWGALHNHFERDTLANKINSC